MYNKSPYIFSVYFVRTVDGTKPQWCWCFLYLSVVCFLKSELVLLMHRYGRSINSVACRLTKRDVFIFFVFFRPLLPTRDSFDLHVVIGQDCPRAYCYCRVWTKNDICDIFWHSFFFRLLVLFFIFLSRQRHKMFIFLLMGCISFQVRMLYISGFNLRTPFYLRKKKIFRTMMQLLPKKAPLLSSVCAYVCVCVSVNARVHAQTFGSIRNGLTVCICIGFSSLFLMCILHCRVYYNLYWVQ